MSLPPALQNKNVQYAILGVAAVAVLIIVFTQILGNSNQPPQDAYMSTGAMPPGMGYGPPGGPGGTGMPGGSAMPGGTGGPGMMGYGTDTAGGGAPLAGKAATVKKKAGPKPPARTDPFKTPAPLVPEPVPIASQLPESNNIYITARQEEVSKPTAEQYAKDVPDPPMRMAGALFGNRVYGVLEINGASQVVTPSQQIGIYRVERIERDRILLSRPSRKGRRIVAAPLTGNPALAAQIPTGDNGIPGGPMGYGGPPNPAGGSAGGGRGSSGG